ncbi:MAG: GGDEF domain-containing protein, partial [Desulfobacterales bacterium]|nr:GGDEF domain-containing protein [Desulfobacterales bacterium]
GHATGDQVIKAIADVLKTCTRDIDLVGRYGGEEFCVVLPDIDLDTAAKIAERIRATIEKTSCAGLKVTASLGVSSMESTTHKPDELIDLADKALYAAKKSGRNRVVGWGRDFGA